jgi:uncharacterized protein YcnI
MTTRRRGAVALLFATVVVSLSASAAWAHTRFEPGEAAPGSVASLRLHVENERSNAGTVKVQLIFMPGDQRITVAELPPTAGWTATVQDGTVGGAPAKGITWTRPTGAPGENPEFALTLGPLPDREGPLVFNVVQTYSNGDVVNWEQENLPGIEAEFPAPVIELVPGAPGVIPSSTVAPSTTAAATTTVAPSTTTVAPAPAEDDDDSSSLPLIIGFIALFLAAVGGGILWGNARRSRAKPQ